MNKFIISLIAAVSATTASAQVSASPGRFSPLAAGYLERARTMLSSGNYPGVIDQLNELNTKGIILNQTEKEEYVFMLARAYYERGDAECVTLLRNFIRDYPASTHALEARLSVGDYFFFHHLWPDALTEYDGIDFDRLNREDFALYTYRHALTQIKTGHYAEARQSLKALKENRLYREAYTFYTAYLDYIDGDYDKAYTGFSKVRSGEKGLEAAYYMTQIDYNRGEYDRVAAKGQELLRSLSDPELAPELNRITGLSFFKLGDYQQAKVS